MYYSTAVPYQWGGYADSQWMPETEDSTESLYILYFTLYMNTYDKIKFIN